MRRPPRHRWLSPGLLVAVASWAGAAPAQDAKAAPATIGSIDAEYRADLRAAERKRLARLGELAAGQPRPEADATFRQYFQVAVAQGLSAEAGPSAERLLRAGGVPPDVRALATLVKVLAEADRGAFEESLKSLAGAVGPDGPKGGAGLSAPERASIVEYYYQALIRGGRYDLARKAMKTVAASAETPAVRDLAERRSRQLGLVGAAAPPIAGDDLDGRPFRLEDARGEVVLVVFWASWCLPSAEEVPRIEEVYRAYRGRGFRVVGIDLDAAGDDGADPKAVLADVRRFLVEYNVPWPTLINGRGDRDLARAYFVGEIPANVLVGRDGRVAHLDLAGARLDAAVAEAVARKP